MSIRSDSPTFPTYLQTCKMSKTRKLNRFSLTPSEISSSDVRFATSARTGQMFVLIERPKRDYTKKELIWKVGLRGKLHFEIAWPKRDYTEKSLFEKPVWEVIFLRRTVCPKWDLNSNHPMKSTIPTKSPTSWNSSNKTNSETSSEKQFRKPVHRTGLINKFSNPLDPFNNPKQYQPANPK